MRIRHSLLCACLWPCLFGTAQASAETASYPGYAEVLRVEKISQQVKRTVPVKRCRWENLPDRIAYRYDSDGHYPRGVRERRVTERRVKRCRTSQETRTTERISGYDVTLSYNGEVFTRRTQTHPGVRMPVTVKLTPAVQLQHQ